DRTLMHFAAAVCDADHLLVICLLKENALEQQTTTSSPGTSSRGRAHLRATVSKSLSPRKRGMATRTELASILRDGRSLGRAASSESDSKCNPIFKPSRDGG